MKIALVYCGITRAGWNTFGRGGDEENFVPHGLALITATCKQAGHEVDCVDLRRMSGWDEFSLVVCRGRYEAMGFSATTPDYGVALAGAQIAKGILPKCKMVIGGVHATVCTERVAADSVWDFIVVREGEHVLPGLLSAVEDETSTSGAARVWGGLARTLDGLPLADREAWGYLEGEAEHPWAGMFQTPFVTVLGSRGCPHRCKFCQPAGRAVFGGKVRFRSMDSLFAELNYLRDKYHFKSLMFHDDLTFMRSEQAMEFADRYQREAFSAPFIIQARTDFTAANASVIARLAEVGLGMAIIGFESGSQRILNFIGKGTTVQDAKDTVNICRRYRVKVMANFMFGFPTETEREAWETAQLAKWMKPEIFSPTFFTPFPGTELYDYCRDRQLLLDGV